jgi:hypothetical protein
MGFDFDLLFKVMEVKLQLHNVIQLRNYCLHLHQLFTLDASDESIYVSCSLSFDLDLLFKVTQVRFCKYSQCDTTPQSLGDLHQNFIMDTSKENTSLAT